MGFLRKSAFLLVASFALLLPAQDEPPFASVYFSFSTEGGVWVNVTSDAEPLDAETLRSALVQAVGGRAMRVDEADYGISAAFDHVTQRRGLLYNADINLQPLFDVFRRHGIGQMMIMVALPETATSEAPGTRQAGPREPVFHFTATTQAAPALRVTYGYRAADLARTGCLALLLLALPVALALGIRRAALRPGVDPAAAWFAYFRFLQWTTMGLFLGWWAASDLLRIPQLLRFAGVGAAGGPWSIFTSVLVVIAPPVLPILAISAVTHSIQQRLTKSEVTRREALAQAAWLLALLLVPMLLVVGGLQWMFEGYYRAGVLAMAAALAAIILCARRLQKARDLAPHALTSGELRDRIFALAERAGVKLRHLYVLPGTKQRMANAFAGRGDMIMLTHYLLQNLSRCEVDAIVAHELAHLQRHDPARLAGMLVGSVATATIVTGMLQGFLFSPLPVLPLSILLALLATWFFQRRMERAADAGSVQLTGDPEAMITALVRLSHLSVIPVQWSRWAERTLTHPSTARRAEAIARRSGIASERLRELLLVREAEPDRYPIPATTVPGGKVFSTDYKNLLTMRVTWSLIAAMTIPPAIFAALSPYGGFLAYVAGVPVTVLVFLLAQNRAPVFGQRELREKLRAKLADAAAGIFVGFAPEAHPRLYENNWSWDVGFLLAAPDCLCYAGEEARFAIDRQQIRGIRLVAGAAGWLPIRAVQVRWLDGSAGLERAFLFRPAGAPSLRRLDAESVKLYQALATWLCRESPDQPLPPPLVALPPPTIGAVSSLAPNVVVTPAAVFRNAVFLFFVALAVALLFGLSAAPAFYVIAVTVSMGILQAVPFLRYKDAASDAVPASVGKAASSAN